MPKRLRTNRVKFMQRKYYYEHKEKILQQERIHRDKLWENKESPLVQHHIKYKEIHGIDEVVLLTAHEHRLLHKKLRREGKCNIPGEKLREISKIAYSRTNVGKTKRSQYKKNNIEEIVFRTTMYPNIRLFESIFYNKKTGNVCFSSSFSAYNGEKLKIIKE
jgi:hypothetical protein